MKIKPSNSNPKSEGEDQPDRDFTAVALAIELRVYELGPAERKLVDDFVAP